MDLRNRLGQTAGVTRSRVGGCCVPFNATDALRRLASVRIFWRSHSAFVAAATASGVLTEATRLMARSAELEEAAHKFTN